ncbi:MAG: lysine biosynthesis protein LysW [Acidobacteriia bacterium]|nr:lysine biosynthesis protein LysW [Terriglobia bacterium]
MASCPECEATIDLEDEDVEEGQLLDCPECGAELEVVNTNPLELDVVATEEEGEENGEGSW